MNNNIPKTTTQLARCETWARRPLRCVGPAGYVARKIYKIDDRCFFLFKEKSVLTRKGPKYVFCFYEYAAGQTFEYTSEGQAVQTGGMETGLCVNIQKLHTAKTMHNAKRDFLQYLNGAKPATA